MKDPGDVLVTEDACKYEVTRVDGYFGQAMHVDTEPDIHDLRARVMQVLPERVPVDSVKAEIVRLKAGRRSLFVNDRSERGSQTEPTRSILANRYPEGLQPSRRQFGSQRRRPR